MTPTARRQLGLTLIGLSLLSGVIIQFSTGKLVKFGPPKLDSTESGGDSVATYTVTSYSQDEQINFPVFIPLAACFAAGVICLAWPAQTPKRPPLLSN